MAEEQLQWINIDDFSPGIQQRVNFQGSSVAPSTKPGAATANTYRCITLADGGLGPLPKRSNTYSVASVDSLTNLYNNRFTISGFHVSGPVFVAPASGLDGVEFHIAYEYIYTNVSQGRKYKWQRHRFWEASPTIDSVKAISATDTTGGSGQMRPTWFHNYRADPTVGVTAGLNPGDPIVGAAWFAGGGGFERFWSMFPNPTTLTSNTPLDIDTTNYNGEHVIAHQGRSILFNRIGIAHGSVGTWSLNENCYFTDANLVTVHQSIDSTGASSVVGETFGDENATGYSCVGSLAASELLLLKLVGGGYRVTGDMSSPTVEHLSGVISPGGARHHGVATPAGFIYLSADAGAWVWSGGETSQSLSPQLEGTFYVNSNTDFLDYVGKLAIWKEWVMFPMNWLYDYRTNGWWRIEDPTVCQIHHWDSTAIGPFLYGAPPTYVDSSTPVVHIWNYGTPSSSYRWESQPIAETVFNQAKLRQVVLVAQGAGTVTLTLTADDGSGTTATDTLTYTLAGTNRPQAIRQTTALTGTHIQVRADASNGSSAAPVIYRIELGFKEIQKLQVSN